MLGHGCLYLHHHHHHHHVLEGLGLIPVPCILKMKLVPPSLPRSSYVSVYTFNLLKTRNNYTPTASDNRERFPVYELVQH